jgi:hypothetical protein
MGETHGYWTGKEVEMTQFFGLDTLFISRFHVLQDALAKFPDVPHVFLCEINPAFGLRAVAYNSMALWMAVDALLKQGKYVTVEVSASHKTIVDRFTDLRVHYPTKMCLLIVLAVPQLEAGGFALKAAPPTVFENRVNEGGVMTVPFGTIQDGLSKWEEYVDDKDGEALE